MSCLFTKSFMIFKAQCATLAVDISGRPVDRVYVNYHQSMKKPIDKDQLSMKKLFSLNVFIVYVYVNLGRSMLFNFVIDLKSIRLQILVSHTELSTRRLLFQ